MTAAILWFIACMLAAGLAAFEGNFTRGQMRRRGITNGFSFLAHTAMWGNLLLIPAVAFGWKYAGQWTPDVIWTKLLIGFAVSLILHIVWSSMTNTQEHILGPGLKFTASGLVNFMQLAFMVAGVLMFYLNTTNVSPRDANIVSALLMMYLPLGNALVGYSKSGKFDAPGVIGTIALMAGVVYLSWNMVM